MNKRKLLQEELDKLDYDVHVFLVTFSEQIGVMWLLDKLTTLLNWITDELKQSEK
jgi:hypothetical protein